MTAAELVRAVEERGGTVTVAGAALIIRPKRVLTDDLRAALVARKSEVIRHLAIAASQSEHQEEMQRAYAAWGRHVANSPECRPAALVRCPEGQALADAYYRAWRRRQGDT
ncbi:MAG: hypothetical protein C4294_19430, partial [Nitrospiraceae bacterium]